MCHFAGKRWADENRLSLTKALLSALEADMGIPISELTKSGEGGNPRIQGTWVHPQVAIHLA